MPNTHRHTHRRMSWSRMLATGVALAALPSAAVAAAPDVVFDGGSLSGTPAAWRNQPVTLTATTDPGAVISMESRDYGTATWQPFTTPGWPVELTTNQDREYRVRADAGAWTPARRVRIDTTPPTLTITATQLTRDEVEVTTTRRDTLSGILPTQATTITYTDQAGARQVASPTVPGRIIVTGEGIADGALTITASTTDQAGNEGAAATTIQVDRSGPSITTPRVSLDAGFAGTVTARITDPHLAAGTTAHAEVATSSGWKRVGSATIPGDGNVEIPVRLAELPDGAHQVRVQATDSLGSTGEATSEPVTISRRTSPLVTPALTWKGSTATFTTSVANGAAVTRILVELEDDAHQWVSLGTLPLTGTLKVDVAELGLPDGTYRARLSSFDAARTVGTDYLPVIIERSPTAPVATTAVTGRTISGTLTAAASPIPVVADTWSLEACPAQSPGDCIRVPFTSVPAGVTYQWQAPSTGTWHLIGRARDVRGREVVATSTLTIAGAPTPPAVAASPTTPVTAAGPAVEPAAGPLASATGRPAHTARAPRVSHIHQQSSPMAGMVRLTGRASGVKAGTTVTVTFQAGVFRTRVLLDGRFHVRVPRAAGRGTARIPGAPTQWLVVR